MTTASPPALMFSRYREALRTAAGGTPTDAQYHTAGHQLQGASERKAPCSPWPARRQRRQRAANVRRARVREGQEDSVSRTTTSTGGGAPNVPPGSTPHRSDLAEHRCHRDHSLDTAETTDKVHGRPGPARPGPRRRCWWHRLPFKPELCAFDSGPVSGHPPSLTFDISCSFAGTVGEIGQPPTKFARHWSTTLRLAKLWANSTECSAMSVNLGRDRPTWGRFGSTSARNRLMFCDLDRRWSESARTSANTIGLGSLSGASSARNLPCFGDSSEFGPG